MATPNTISADKLARLIGTPACPALVDLRSDAAFEADPRLIPGSVRRPSDAIGEWAPALRGRLVVTICEHGRSLSHGAAAWLRDAGATAEALEGGFSGWAGTDLPAVPVAKLPERDAQGRTKWVTRSRPKVDRVACPWLIRRFVDPQALFLFVPPAEVADVARRYGATPFDIDDPDVFWSHRGDLCTFDVMVEEFGLTIHPLLHLARIVRGADTARPDLAPEVAGLLAASLGLSRIHADDLDQIEAGMSLYDAFFRWCRDATAETHNWPTNKIGGAR